MATIGLEKSLDLRHMRHFVAVAEELHFGRAAQRLNIAQPPLSQSIQRLELSLGVQLLNRSRRSVELTDAGSIFLEEARRTLRHADLARKLTQRAAEQVLEVRVAFVGPALYQVLPRLLKRFRQIAPDVDVRLFEQPSTEQVNGIDAGDYDVGFCTRAVDDKLTQFEALVVERAPYCAAVPADWPVAQQASVSLTELAELPWIQSPAKYHGAITQSASLFKPTGTMPKVVQEATQTNTTLSLVGAGLGCAMVTSTAALAQPRNVRIIPFTAGEALVTEWELVMIWNPRQISEQVRLFVETARQHAAELRL